MFHGCGVLGVLRRPRIIKESQLVKNRDKFMLNIVSEFSPLALGSPLSPRLGAESPANFSFFRSSTGNTSMRNLARSPRGKPDFKKTLFCRLK